MKNRVVIAELLVRYPVVIDFTAPIIAYLKIILNVKLHNFLFSQYNLLFLQIYR